jgi:hypothetical protein
MNEKQFLTNIIRLYHNARKPVFANPKIRRGRSHSVASAAEDFFALFLAEKIKCDLLYVDQPISFDGYKARFYPDIVVIKSKQVIALCDLKMDLGWKRNSLYDFCKRHAKLLAKIRGKKCKIRDGITKEDKFYLVSKKASLNVVIITDQNINSKILKTHLKKIKPFSRLVRVFILSQGEHPNAYNISVPKLLKKITINKLAFSSLIKTLS